MAATDYHALAAQAHDDAQTATLANVRDRFLRAEAAWRAMAQRQDLTDEARARRDIKAQAAAPDVQQD